MPPPKKLALRGSTRAKSGVEQLCYFRGGFGKLSEHLASEIRQLGSFVFLGVTVKKIDLDAQKINFVQTDVGKISAKHFLFTQATPLIAELFSNCDKPAWLSRLNSIEYLGNICLILRLRNSLSQTYWLNVNDPGFPFVGVIEHTNFDAPKNYGGDHIVYLSRYLSVRDPIWSYTNVRYFELAKSCLKIMFPSFEDDWVVEYKIWRSEHAQPITGKNYSKIIPEYNMPFCNGKIATMAQIYPEDRGTNYAIREGEKIAEEIISDLNVE